MGAGKEHPLGRRSMDTPGRGDGPVLQSGLISKKRRRNIYPKIWKDPIGGMSGTFLTVAGSRVSK